MPEMTVNQAISEALAEEMRQRSACGDVRGRCGDEAAGPRDRVRRTRVSATRPLAEAIIAGTAAGAAATGLRPVIDLLFVPFMCYSMDQIVNSAGKAALHLRRPVLLSDGGDGADRLRMDRGRPAQPQPGILVRARAGSEGRHAVHGGRFQGPAEVRDPRRQPGVVLHGHGPGVPDGRGSRLANTSCRSARRDPTAGRRRDHHVVRQDGAHEPAGCRERWRRKASRPR